MRKITILIAFGLYHISFSQMSSQDNLPEYFQQQVNYTITVTLNDKEHSLKGFENIEYINHSKDTLKYIYFHLWPNAYKNHSTCLARQLLALGNTSFYYSKPEERGYIDSLNFLVDGNVCKFEINPDTIDIGKLYLNNPLLPGQSVMISTPFYVKIPDARFSRLGHKGQAYYITQWYPKPAVYDRTGWHPMPYLHEGEFYSEFGNYDVQITLPKNYVLAATGNRLPNEEEEQFIQKRIAITQRILQKKDTALSITFPPDANNYKTVRFVESNIHDFAWFADKRFLILNDEIQLLESTKKVKTWLYFLPNNIDLWSKALTYINDAVLFYSYYIGDYPYNHVSAVDGSTAAGGGMEYPTITLINQSSTDVQLEETIVHEVGHNWFYGILANNEREYPAMDEGVNSFYEMRYLYTKYPDLKLIKTFGLPSDKKILGLEHIPQKKYYEYAYWLLATHNADMPILQPTTKYTELNYAGIVYCKTAMVVEYLKNYFGEELFDEAMAFYFKTFKYKHPYPKDLKLLLDYFGGGNNIPLIENLTTTSKKIDYKISHVKKNTNNIYEITLKNKGGFTAPIVVQAIKDNKIIAEVWKKDVQKKETFSFPPIQQVDYFRIDYKEITLDINRRNNTIKTSGLFKKIEPLELNFGWKIDNPYRTQIHYSPIGGWNYNDGTMLGMAIYNYGIFPKKLEGFVAPMYAFKSNTLVGSANWYFNFFPSQYFKIFQFGLASKSYSYFYSSDPVGKKTFEQYFKLEPYIHLQFKQKNPLLHRRNYVSIRSVMYNNRNSQNPLYPTFNKFFNWMNEYAYTFEKTSVLTPYRINLILQHNDVMIKGMLEWSGKIHTSANNYFSYRVFAGRFLLGNQNDKAPYAFRPSGYSNWQDYMLDYYYFGRNQFRNIYLAQFAEAEGNLKTQTALGYAQEWLASINLYSPSLLGFRIFADVVVSNEKYPVFYAGKTSYEYALYDVGIQFSLSNFINIYFPIIMNTALKDNLKLNKYPLIRYSINIHRFNPRFEATRRIE